MKLLAVFVCFVVGSLIAFIVFSSSSLQHATSVIIPFSVPTLVPTIPKTQFSLEDPPRNSIKASITAMSGNIYWESRTATEPSQLLNPIVLTQGEKIIASDSGILTFTLPNAADVALSTKSELNIIQTIPSDIVFQQVEGSISYSKTGTFPVSIRTLRLLTRVESGTVIISFDDEDTVVLEVPTGKAIVAYNDADFISQVVTISQGKRFIFNNSKRDGQIQ